MKRALLTLLALIVCSYAGAQSSITIKGKVQFTDRENFEIRVIERDGPDKREVAKTVVAPDKSYSLVVKLQNPGLYYLECGTWQSVAFWGENENIEVDFRGADTAKMPIKNPPYVNIKGGRNNELMNRHNYNGYRNYQNMIAISRSTYRTPMADSLRGKLSGELYRMNNDDREARTAWLIESNMDCNSVLALLPSITDKTLIEKVLQHLEQKDPSYAPLVKYKAARAQKVEQTKRNELGQVAPAFSYPTPDGSKTLGPKDFQGKFLIVDFWASWCGPCRAEVPSMKKIYDQYNKKGVEFLSVSIDTKPEAWQKALTEEQMPWAQVLAPSSGKEITKAYNFSGIPYIILLDQNGRIIAKGLRGEGLAKALEDAISGKLTAESVKPKTSVSMGAMGM